MVGNSWPKGQLIPHKSREQSREKGRNWPSMEELASYQLVGGVKAYQGNDG